MLSCTQKLNWTKRLTFYRPKHVIHRHIFDVVIKLAPNLRNKSPVKNVTGHTPIVAALIRAKVTRGTPPQKDSRAVIECLKLNDAVVPDSHLKYMRTLSRKQPLIDRVRVRLSDQWRICTFLLLKWTRHVVHHRHRPRPCMRLHARRPRVIGNAGLKLSEHRNETETKHFWNMFRFSSF